MLIKGYVVTTDSRVYVLLFGAEDTEWQSYWPLFEQVLNTLTVQ